MYKRGVKQYRITVNRPLQTLDARKLSATDYINVSGDARLHLILPARNELHLKGAANHFDFSFAHGRFQLPGARIRGFLYYHVPYPSQFLSGGLRFRSTRNRDAMAHEEGSDLPNLFGLPWHLSLAQMIARPRFSIYLQQLVLDELLTQEQLRVARQLLVYNPERAEKRPLTGKHVYALGEPFAIDLSEPLSIAVTGPHSVVKGNIYPKIMHRGGAIVRFERAGDRDVDQLCLRIVKPLADYHERLRGAVVDENLKLAPNLPHYWYLPHCDHLPPIRAGDLLPDPDSGGEPWVWQYTGVTSRDAALHCLLHPYIHFPQSAPEP
ncbi:hypothetical protein B0H19DRAFT_1159384 [Mycena capillaripes]|nr:hypothetical protein B0H19DRAFT_1159384 [Mycena capillaripes]